MCVLEKEEADAEMLEDEDGVKTETGVTVAPFNNGFKMGERGDSSVGRMGSRVGSSVFTMGFNRVGRMGNNDGMMGSRLGNNPDSENSCESLSDDDDDKEEDEEEDEEDEESRRWEYAAATATVEFEVVLSEEE